jgi:hypothetical protein
LVDFEISGLVSYSGEGIEKMVDTDLKSLGKNQCFALEKDQNNKLRLLSGKENIKMFYKERKTQI